MHGAMEISFIADSNVGKLARWLRIMGYDTLFFNHIEDSDLVKIALKEKRVVLTRDTHIQERRVAASGQIRVILTRSDDPKHQLRQVIDELELDWHLGQFTRCLECNQSLVPRTREEVKELVPPYVFRTQTQYMQCPSCLRVYWRGTHWQKMKEELERIAGDRS
jgi:uncharacterized protein with PIN domain